MNRFLVIFGLGTNLGDRMARLKDAVRRLDALGEGLAVSPVYESAALLPEGAPPEWDIAYYNMAVALYSRLSPQALLQEAKIIEQAMGRSDRGRWGPREIDVDILAYGNKIVEEMELQVPHPGLLQRDFALVPLADVAPDWMHPVAGKSARELARSIPTALRKMEQQ